MARTASRLRAPGRLVGLLALGLVLAGAPAAQAHVSASPNPLDFGPVPVGTPATKAVTLAADVDESITGLSSNNAAFTVKNNCGPTTPGGGSCTADVTFMPTTPSTAPVTAMIQGVFNAGAGGTGTFSFQAIGIGVAATPGSPTTLTTNVFVSKTVGGASLTEPFGTPVGFQGLLSGTNVSSATGSVAYTVYSGSGCTNPVAAVTAPVTNGLVAPSDQRILLPGEYNVGGAFFSTNQQNLPSSSACAATTLTYLPPKRLAPGCYAGTRASAAVATKDLGAIAHITPSTAYFGESFNVRLPCSLSRRTATLMREAPDKTVTFVYHGVRHRFRGLIHYINLYDFEVRVPKIAAARAAQVGRPLPYALAIQYFARAFAALLRGGPVRIGPRPAVAHPTCSGTVPSTFLIFPNHAPSPGATSLLLSCTLRNAAVNGFTGAWAPMRVQLYDYPSFQNLKLVGGRLVPQGTFPVRPPVNLPMGVIGPQDIDVTLPAGLARAVYVVVVRTARADVPSANVLNIP